MVEVLNTIHKDVDRVEVEAVNSKTQRELFAKRVKIFPKRTNGTFRKFKWWVMFLTLLVYYIDRKSVV